MTSLSASWLPRVVWIPGTGEEIEVRPATVGEAIAVLEAFPGLVDGDEDDAELLQDVLEGWLPAELIVDLEEMRPQGMVKVLRRLLFDGVRLEDVQGPPAGADESAEPGPPRWDLLLGDYVSLCRDGAWATVREVPWPFFLRMLRVKESLAARELLRWARVIMLPHLGKKAKKSLSELTRQAKGKGSGAQEPPKLYSEDELKDWKPDEEIERERAELRKAMGRPAKGGGDE